MLYSVWNQGAGGFDYYEAPGVEGKVNVPKPTHLRSRTLGSTPTQAAWPLPAGARKVGSGEVARGRVAAIGGGLSLSGVEDSSMLTIGLLLLSGLLLWRYVR